MALTINLVPIWVTYHDNEFRCLLDPTDPPAQLPLLN